MVDTDNTQDMTVKAGGSDIGLSSLTRKPETLSKLSNQGAAMKKM